MSSAAVSSVSPPVHKPISDEKYREFKQEIIPLMAQMVMAENRKREELDKAKKLDAEIIKLNQESKEAEKKAKQLLASSEQKAFIAMQLMASGQQKIQSGQQKIQSGQQKIQSGQQKIQSGQQKIESGQQKIQSGQQKEAEGLEGMKRADDKLKAIETTLKGFAAKYFHEIFHGKDPLPPDQADSLYTTYSLGETITLETEKSQLNSMTAVTTYLDKYPKITLLNFKRFKEHVEGIRTLAAYLAQSSCSVKSVGINKNISAEDKASLDAAVKARNGALKITYFDS